MAGPTPKSMVVIAAHTGDYVWRCAGAIALHAKLGYRVAVICLSYGERGEAAKLYVDPAMTAPKARSLRKIEAEKAAAILGAEIHFFDGDDYVLHTNEAMLDRAVAIMREVQVGVILTHTRDDPGNIDHVVASQFALQARMSAQAVGRSGGKAIGSPEIHGMTIGAPQVYCFEPHQSELCSFKPDTLLDISPVWEQKWAAIQCIESQPLMWDHYRNMAIQRGSVARGRPKYAEAFQRIFPSTVQELT
jgi:4-oxalomesaconate hydratase